MNFSLILNIILKLACVVLITWFVFIILFKLVDILKYLIDLKSK
jgi:hypothetical protein